MHLTAAAYDRRISTDSPADPAGALVTDRPQRLGRGATALIGLLDGLVTAATPLAVLVVAALVAWGSDAVGRTSWTAYARGGAIAWLIGHGVDVRFEPGAGAGFTVTAAALGGALVTALLAVRAGRRAAATGLPRVAVVVCLVTVAAAAELVALLCRSAVAMPSLWQAPVAVGLATAAGLGVGLARAGRDRGGATAASPALAAGLRIGAGAVAALLGVAALAALALLALALPRIIGLAEGLGAAGGGGLLLAVLQMELLPTLVVWGAAWFAGPGFAVGAGSAVGPFGTAVGPLPAVPVLGALPASPGPYGPVAVLVPVAVAFLLAVVAARRDPAPPRGAAVLGAALVAGCAAGALLGLLAAVSAGSAGPGRLGAVGPDALLVALAVGAETALATALGLATAVRGRGAAPPPEDGWYREMLADTEPAPRD